tara:strand:- start:1163 stop:1633 length:471 start_codon:yes stop_codon:yes gene_type:complete
MAAYGDRMSRAGTLGAPAKGMGSASPGKIGNKKGKSGGAFASIVNAINDIAANFGNSSNINPSSPPSSDMGKGSGNSDRIPAGPRPEYTFAGANPLTTSGFFPVGHPNYKPPGSPDGADAVRANIINRKKKIAGLAGSSGSLTSTGSSATPALLGT